VLASEFGGFHTVQTYSQMCPLKLTLADLNGDGFVEIIGGNVLTDDVGVLANRGDGTFNPSRNILATDGASGVETLDLDGDGQLDLIATGFTLGGAIVGLINETPPPTELDCNRNGLPDSCDILAGTADANANGVPDECEFHCPGDLDGNSQVGLSDLTILLANFGTTEGATPEQGDSNGDGDVDLGDLTVLLGAFGSTCP
jgi:FG-GAP-like repeat